MMDVTHYSTSILIIAAKKMTRGSDTAKETQKQHIPYTGPQSAFFPLLLPQYIFSSL
jgi:hypothetical protein